MAKFVIAGKANCPHYAKAELLGDYLQRNLPNFSIHKWPIAANEWDQWLKSTCDQYQWKLNKTSSPIIWRELIDRGGRGKLIGDLNDFQEYAQSYYGVLIDQFMSNSSTLFRSIAEENAQQYDEDLKFKKEYFDTHVHRYYIGIIGADHPCTYALFPHLLSSSLFPQRDICVRLTTNDPSKLSSLKALAMEIEDLACAQFHQIEVTLESDAQTYEQMDLLIVLDDYFHQAQENYFDQLVAEKARLKQSYDDANLFDDERPPFEPQRMTYDLPPAYERYRTLANRIQPTVKSTCRILLACANSTMVATQAFLQTIRTLPTNQILGLSRIIENLAKARIGKKLHTDIQNVVDLHIIGDINGEYIIDTSHCQTIDYDGAIWAKTFARNSTEMLADAKWVKEVIGKEVEQRYFELYTFVEHNRALIQSQSSAIISFIHDWLNGSNDDRSYSCVMLCSSSTLGLLETNDEERIIDTIVCSIPVRMHAHDHIEPIELNFSNENRAVFTRIIKDIQNKYQLD